MKANFDDVLDFFFWGLEVFSRRDCGLILAGLRQCESDWQASQLLRRMERRRLIQREGRGAKASFAVTATGAKRVAVVDPRSRWNAGWDGKGCLFTYDLPEQRRSERFQLWRALHAHKLGLLQRSVWVWPHAVEPILEGILQATGIPECFCGFDCDRLFLCSDAELVAAAWDFRTIHENQRAYVESASQFIASLKAARDLQQVACVVASEREAYQNAFALDPLLPRRLWPDPYEGPKVEQHHGKFQARLRCRVQALAECGF